MYTELEQITIDAIKAHTPAARWHLADDGLWECSEVGDDYPYHWSEMFNLWKVAGPNVMLYYPVEPQ